MPDRFARIVVANSGLPTGDQTLPDAFFAWRKFSQETPEFKVGQIVSGGCATRLDAATIAAYDAPFPDDRYKAGARIFPTLVASSPDDPSSASARAAWEVLMTWEKPVLLCFSDQDPVTGGGDKVFRKLVPGTKDQPHRVMAGGGHFLQEDVGPELARHIVSWMA